jgi:putative Mn2+ efflux pump MntP
MLQLGILPISLSIDALGVGFSYRMRGIKITKKAKLVMTVLTACVMGLSMAAGRLFSHLLPPEIMNLFGTALLVLMGLVIIYNALFGQEAFYDFNKSKNIELREAVLLGLALSSDAASCGVALAFVNTGSFLLPVLSGLMQGVFLWLGEILYTRGTKTRLGGQKGLGAFSGGILLLMAVIKLKNTF